MNSTVRKHINDYYPPIGILYNEENSMLETAFKSSVDVAKAKMATSGVELNVISQTVPLYDSFETQHFGKTA